MKKKAFEKLEKLWGLEKDSLRSWKYSVNKQKSLKSFLNYEHFPQTFAKLSTQESLKFHTSLANKPLELSVLAAAWNKPRANHNCAPPHCIIALRCRAVLWQFHSNMSSSVCTMFRVRKFHTASRSAHSKSAHLERWSFIRTIINGRESDDILLAVCFPTQYFALHG